ncbi:MAG: tetratricopeptide repeat protein [Anaerolineae bacterium]
MARVSLQEYCDEARDLINAHAYDDAIAICRHILKRYPKHIRAYQILGEACLDKGEIEEAIDIFKRLLDHADPENFVAYAGLGVAYEEKGQIPEAIWHMERAFELAPNNEEIRSALRRLYAKRDGKEPERIKYNKAAFARVYAKGGQYRQAIRDFRDLLESDVGRDRMDLKLSFAETLWRDGRREEAAAMAREILQICPDCLKAILILGKVLLEKGRQDEAWAVLANARYLDPENKLAQALFGEQSPLPPQTIRIPRLEKTAEAEVTTAATTPETPAVPSAVEEIAETETVPEEVLIETVPAGLEPVMTSPEEPATPARMAEAEVESIEPSALPTEEVPVAAPSTAKFVEEARGEALPASTEPVPPVSTAAPEAPAEETVLASAPAMTPSVLALIERYKLQLEQRPQDDETRLALARAYLDQGQMKLALEQYTLLFHGKSKLLPELIRDVETIVASRPDNLEAHELLADLYVKAGQLQKGLDRYRWILRRLEEKTS